MPKIGLKFQTIDLLNCGLIKPQLQNPFKIKKSAIYYSIIQRFEVEVAEKSVNGI